MTSIERGCRHFLVAAETDPNGVIGQVYRIGDEQILAVNLRATRASDDSKFAWARKEKPMHQETCCTKLTI